MRAGGLVERKKRSLLPQARSLNGLPKVLSSAGELEVRLATTKREIRRAQKLRFQVFFAEGGAVADPTARLIGRDVCRFDKIADHLIVVDNSVKRIDGSPTVVGAYRLLRQDVAQAQFGFYSAAEFEIGALLARHPDKRVLELGRDHCEQMASQRLIRQITVGFASGMQRIDAPPGDQSLGNDPDILSARISGLNLLKY